MYNVKIFVILHMSCYGNLINHHIVIKMKNYFYQKIKNRKKAMINSLSYIIFITKHFCTNNILNIDFND